MEQRTPQKAYELLNKLLPEEDLIEQYMSDYYSSDEVHNISDVEKYFHRELDYMDDNDREIINNIAYNLSESVRRYGNDIRIVLNDMLDNIINNISNE